MEKRLPEHEHIGMEKVIGLSITIAWCIESAKMLELRAKDTGEHCTTCNHARRGNEVRTLIELCESLNTSTSDEYGRSMFSALNAINQKCESILSVTRDMRNEICNDCYRDLRHHLAKLRGNVLEVMTLVGVSDCEIARPNNREANK